MTEQETKGHRRKWPKRLLIALVIIAVIIGIFVIGVPMYLSSEGGKNMIVGKINNSIDGKVDIGSLRVGLIRPVKVENLSFKADDGNTNIQVEQITTRPKLLKLMGGTLDFGKTVLDKPRIELTVRRSAKQGQPGSKEKSEKKKTSSQQSSFSIPFMDLEVNNGAAAIELIDNGMTGQKLQFAQINSTLDLKGLGKKSDFDMSFAILGDRVSGQSQVSASGSVTPGGTAETGWTLKDTNGDFEIEVDSLELETLEPLIELLDLGVQASGLLDADITIGITDGAIAKADGRVEGNNIDVQAEALGGDGIVGRKVVAEMKIQTTDKLYQIDRLDISADDWLSIQAEGALPKDISAINSLVGSSANQRIEGDFNVDIARVAQMMPKTLGVREGVRITSGNLNGSVSTFVQGGGRRIEGNAKLTNLGAVADGKNVSLSKPVQADMKIQSADDGFVVDNLDLTSSFAQLNCSGRSERLSFNADADLSGVQNELGQFVNLGGYRMNGNVSSKGIFSIAETGWGVSGTASAESLELVNPQGIKATEPKANASYNLQFEKEPKILNIEGFSVEAGLGKINVDRGMVAFVPEGGIGEMSTKVGADVNLGKLRQFGVLFKVMPAALDLGGMYSGTVDIKKAGPVFNVSTDDSRAKNLKIFYTKAGQGQKQLFDQKDVQAKVEAGFDTESKSINIKSVELISDDIKIRKGRFSSKKDDGKVNLSGKCDYDVKLGRVSGMLKDWLPKGLSISGRHEDNLEFDTTYSAQQNDQMLANMNLQTSVGFERLMYMGMDVGRTTLPIDIKEGLWEIPLTETTVNQGTGRFAGSCDFKQKPSMMRLSEPMKIAENIQINPTISAVMLKYVNPIFSNLAQVSGKLTFDCNELAVPVVGGSKNDAVVAGTIDVSEMRAQGGGLLTSIGAFAGGGSLGTDMAIEPTRFRLANGRVHYDKMQVNFGDNPLTFGGDVYLDKRLGMTVELPWTFAGRTRRVGDTAKGITVPIGGTVDKPTFKAESIIQRGAEELIREEAGRLLEDLLKK